MRAVTDFATGFWPPYPKKVGKFYAEQCWDRAIAKGHLAIDIIAGIQPYIDNKPDFQSFMDPSKFINQGHWTNEYDTPATGPDLTKYELGNPDQIRQYEQEFPKREHKGWVPIGYGKLKVVS